MESPFLFFNLCSNSLSASHWLTDPPAKTILMKCTAWENRCYHWLRQVHSLSKENVDANILSNFHGKTTNKKQTANPWTPVILSIPKQRPKKNDWHTRRIFLGILAVGRLGLKQGSGRHNQAQGQQLWPKLPRVLRGDGETLPQNGSYGVGKSRFIRQFWMVKTC